MYIAHENWQFLMSHDRQSAEIVGRRESEGKNGE
jgi:hypothetical protein